MRKLLSVSVTAAALAIFLAASASYADRRPHEGKVVRVETVEKSADVSGEKVSNVEHYLVVQGEKGDQWKLYWDDTTKFKHSLMPSELKEGDSVHFDYVEKDGKMWITELRRTKKADRD
jgi:hypothetical protein